MTHIYGGPPFAVGLWGISILTLYTFGAGLFHAIRGEIVEHQRIMILNFGAMLIAPFLRLWWLILGMLFVFDPENTQARNHVAVLMFLGLQTVIGSIIVVRLFTSSSHHRPTSAAIKRMRQRCHDALPTILRVARVVSTFLGLLLINQTVLRFMGSFDLFTHQRPELWSLKEAEVFSQYPWAFWLSGLGLAGSWILSPIILKSLYQRPQNTQSHQANQAGQVDSVDQIRRIYPSSLGLWSFFVCVVSYCVGWLGIAHGFGVDGIRGWGSAVFYLVMACSIGILLIFWLRDLWRGDRSSLREFTLHIIALSLSPVTIWILQTAFLWAEFSWGDAFLSAAVVATSLNLSFSYYYTVYAQKTEESEQRAELTSHRIFNSTSHVTGRKRTSALKPAITTGSHTLIQTEEC